MKSQLYAVQRETGHEVVSVKVDVAKVSDVTVKFLDDGKVALVKGRTTLATSEQTVDEGENLIFARWSPDAKLEEPVSKNVQRPVSGS